MISVKGRNFVTENVLGPTCPLCGKTVFSEEPCVRREAYFVHEGCLLSLENEWYDAEAERRG